jgi:hypothetical protein
MGLPQWIELVAEVGVDVRPLNEQEVYLLAGKIINDVELRQRCLKYIVEGILPIGARARVVREMSPADRVALRDRILGVKVLPVRVQASNESR